MKELFLIPKHFVSFPWPTFCWRNNRPTKQQQGFGHENALFGLLGSENLKIFFFVWVEDLKNIFFCWVRNPKNIFFVSVEESKNIFFCLKELFDSEKFCFILCWIDQNNIFFAWVVFLFGSRNLKIYFLFWIEESENIFLFWFRGI